mmetsp:Transcript_18760/g.18063  ORF Transcript_18760/g.18063 Transcript_18760/m.18063 type:complete len:80 (-) Transcript_18760:40-279(-)
MFIEHEGKQDCPCGLGLGIGPSFFIRAWKDVMVEGNFVQSPLTLETYPLRENRVSVGTEWSSTEWARALAQMCLSRWAA